MSDAVSNPQRLLALVFPTLPTDRLKRKARSSASGPDASVAVDPAPVVTVMRAGGASALAAVDEAAAAIGLHPGMTLATARAIRPGQFSSTWVTE